MKDDNWIIGADECGYGSLAGNLCVCGVKAPKDWTYPGLKDSKQLSARKRNNISTDWYKITLEKLSVLKSNGELSFTITCVFSPKLIKGSYKCELNYMNIHNLYSLDIDLNQPNGRIWLGYTSSFIDNISFK